MAPYFIVVFAFNPGLIKDSTMTRPGVTAIVDPSKPLATEAHPNPSIPEAVEETPAKGNNHFKTKCCIKIGKKAVT